MGPYITIKYKNITTNFIEITILMSSDTHVPGHTY